jgi:hypothetical protein
MHQNQNEFEKASSKKEVQRTLFQVLDIATSERDANLVDFSTGGTTGFAVIFFTLSDVAAHVNREPEGDYRLV